VLTKRSCGTHRAQVGSVLSILGFPTTISRALARVTATLNLWKRKAGVSESQNHVFNFVCVRIMFLCRCVRSADLLVLDEAEVELSVDLHVVAAAPNCRHQDHSPLLTLELLHRTDLTHVCKHTSDTSCAVCQRD